MYRSVFLSFLRAYVNIKRAIRTGVISSDEFKIALQGTGTIF